MASDTKKQPDAASNSNGEEQPSGRRVNKMDCVRKALSTLGHDAQPKAIAKYLVKKHHLAMSLKMISTYKSKLLKEMGESPRARPSAPAIHTPAARTTPSVGGTIKLDEIRAVKELADRIGVARVRDLMGVLYS
jgi:hypothetical protein